MGWEQRLRDAAYTSAETQTRTVFDYEDVSREVEKHTGAFNFPGVAGTYVQDLGHSGYKYPFRLFFWGDDYDEEADAFEASLLEKGAGVLEHPIYGRKSVLPFGAISRRDDLKTKANQAVIEVTFWETIPEIYPLSQLDPADAASNAILDFFGAAAAQFADLIGLDTAGEKATFKGKYQALQGLVKSGLQTVADTQADVAEAFDTIDQSINSSIDLLIGEPLTLAFQTLALIKTPALAFGLIQAKLDGYKNLADSLTGGGSSGPENIVTPTLDSEASNQFHTNDLYASGSLGGSLESTLNVEFETKTDALAAADFVLTQFDQLTTWRDDNFAALATMATVDQLAASIDSGESYQALQDAVAVVAGFLVEISFNLKQEKAFILTRSRNFVELVAELYGNVTDDDLNFFINSNALTGSELLEIPAGRRIVYYV